MNALHDTVYQLPLYFSYHWRKRVAGRISSYVRRRFSSLEGTNSVDNLPHFPSKFSQLSFVLYFFWILVHPSLLKASRSRSLSTPERIILPRRARQSRSNPHPALFFSRISRFRATRVSHANVIRLFAISLTVFLVPSSCPSRREFSIFFSISETTESTCHCTYPTNWAITPPPP